MDSVSPNWHDVRPESDVENFTQCSDERRQIFERVRQLGHRTDLPPVTWAFFQIADVEKLKGFVEGGTWALLTGIEPAIEPRVIDVVRLWQQKPATKTKTASNVASPNSLTPGPSSQAPSSPLRTMSPLPSTSRTRSKRKYSSLEASPARDKQVAERYKERDGNLCAVSRMAGTDAAHIYPWMGFGAEDPRRVGLFWETLGMF